MSRLPLSNTHEQVPVPAEWIHLVDFLEESTPVTAKDIAGWTKSDSLLSKVYHYCLSGWPDSKIENELKPFYERRSELSIQGDCLLWGIRIIIPPKGRATLLQELHSEHIGISRMKQLARSYFWWPNMDSEIEQKVNACSSCIEKRNFPPKAELHPWAWPQNVWHRVHIDYAGPMKGYHFLVIIDATSKWTEIYKTKTITSEVTIGFLRSCFARFGIPAVLVSDNATNFKSVSFQNYLQSLGVCHLPTSVHSPNMNGLAERMVQTFKNGVQHFVGVSHNDVQKKLDQFLMKYRMSPHSTTGVPPSELMFGRKIRNIFDLLRPNEAINDWVACKQSQMKNDFNKKKPRTIALQTNEKVRVRNYGKGPNWKKAIITSRTGAVTYKCRLVPDDVIVQRHLNQIWPDHESSTTSESTSDSQNDSFDTVHDDEESSDDYVYHPTVRVTRSGRVSKPPDRTNL